MVDVCFEVVVADVCFVFFAVAFGFELSPGSFAHVLALVKSVILLFGGCLKMRQLFLSWEGDYFTTIAPPIRCNQHRQYALEHQ